LYAAAVRSIETALIKRDIRNALVVADDHRAAVDAVLAFAHAVAEGSVDHTLEGMEAYFVGDDACQIGAKGDDDCTRRLILIIEEAARVGGAILVVRRLDALMEAMYASGTDAIELVSKALHTHKVPVIAIADSKGYHRTLVANREVAQAFEFVRVDVDTDEDARVFLEDAISLAERRSKAVVTVGAIDEALAIARRTRPGFSPSFAALDVVDDVLEGIKDEEPTLVDGAAIRRYLGEVEVPDVSSSTEVELDQVEKTLLMRVIGQEEAISRVVATLRTSYAGLRRDDRPIACMLFVGPTGSGKGELITAIAQQLIGDDSVVELSGGDYADEAAGERLEASLVAILERKQCVVAIEDVDVISASARVILESLMAGTLSALHARDSVIIASTSIAAEQAARSAGIAEITEVLRHNGVPKEFIDRFDALVPFRALSREAFRSVVIRALRRAADSMRERGVSLEVTPFLVDTLSTMLYDERFGASEVDRAALQAVEDPVARALLAGTIRKGQTVELLPKDTANPSGGLIAKVR
jgi:ATP-dependent Clp protease ATP-binding subunit ClpA